MCRLVSSIEAASVTGTMHRCDLHARRGGVRDRDAREPADRVCILHTGRCEVNFVFIVTDRPTGGPLSLVFRSVPPDRPTFRRAQRGNFLTIPESARPTDRP